MTGVGDFEAFFAEHYSPVVRGLTVALGDRDRAEDAAQVGFERAFRKWRSVGSMNRPAAWVYVVAIRQQRRWLRDDRTRPLLTAPAASPDPAQAGVAAAELRDLLATLGPRQRTAVVLRHGAGLSMAEVAKAMGIKVGTVKATLHAAHARLRVAPEDQLEDSRCE